MWVIPNTGLRRKCRITINDG